jgi:hypothetical protein
MAPLPGVYKNTAPFEAVFWVVQERKLNVRMLTYLCALPICVLRVSDTAAVPPRT